MNETKTEITNLTASRVARQNVLNNMYAIDNIKKVVGIRCILFEGEYRILKHDAAIFFEVSDRAIENVIAKNQEELAENGYALYEGNKLESFKLAIAKAGVSELNFGYKARHFATFNFRAFLNVAMLPTRSELCKIHARHSAWCYIRGYEAKEECYKKLDPAT